MNPFPKPLAAELDALISRYKVPALLQARKELTERYKNVERGSETRFIENDLQRVAYLATRLPATYAVASHVLKECLKRSQGLSIQTILDLGAGPGTATWAAAEWLPDLKKATLIEQDAPTIALGKKLAANDGRIARNWIQADLNEKESFPEHDAVILSYVVGELTTEQLDAIVAKAWLAAKRLLIVIEPGTPIGYQAMLRARGIMIDRGGTIIAPCPHNGRCPLPAGDWCHFSQRLERSSVHRVLKEGEYGYEDEKFSYAASVKGAGDPCEARILRHPEKHSGHMRLKLCTRNGLELKTLARSDGAIYKTAKKLDWGDALF